MRSRRTSILLLGGLIVVIAAGVLTASDVSAVGGAGEECLPGGYAACPTNYICKQKTPGSKFTCQCAWGEIEVGLFKIEKGVSICSLLGTSGEGPAWFVQQAVTAVIALTIMAAVVSIVIGGYIYMTAGGDADRVRTAKVWIGSAILGIILALLAWLILASIATNLVKFPTTTTSSPTSTPPTVTSMGNP